MLPLHFLLSFLIRTLLLDLLHFLLVLRFHALTLLVLLLLELLKVLLAFCINLRIHISSGIFRARGGLPRTGWLGVGRIRGICRPIHLFRWSVALGGSGVVRSRRLC